MMKSHIPKQKRNIIKYRKYKYFNKIKFEKKILNKLSKCNKETFQIDEFKELFVTVLFLHQSFSSQVSRSRSCKFGFKKIN